MALQIDVSQISSQQAQQLTEALIVYPESKKKKHYGTPAKTTAIQCYRLTENQLYVPFCFGSRFLGKTNDFLGHPKVPLKLQADFVPRDYQSLIVEEVCKHFRRCRVSTIVARPGKGKTIMSIMLAAKLSFKTCILLPIDLSEQWYQEVCRTTEGARVWWVGGNAPIPDDPQVIVAYRERVGRIPAALRAQVGFLILDEAHRLCTKTGMEAVLEFTPKYTLACTATFERYTDGLHKIMEAVVGLDKVSPAHDDLDFTVFQYHTGLKPVRISNSVGTPDWTTLTQSVMYNPALNEMAADLAQLLVRYGRKTMFLTRETQHVKDLEKLFRARGIPCEQRSRTKKSYPDTPILISNTQLSGTGFDEASYCLNFNKLRIQVVVVMMSIADVQLLEQTCGRAFRHPSPVMIWMHHTDTIFDNHWRSARRWALKNNAKVLTYKPHQTMMAPDGREIVIPDPKLEEWLAQRLRTEGSGIPEVRASPRSEAASSSSFSPSSIPGLEGFILED